MRQFNTKNVSSTQKKRQIKKAPNKKKASVPHEKAPVQLKKTVSSTKQLHTTKAPVQHEK